jgi:hypothetical protein
MSTNSTGVTIPIYTGTEPYRRYAEPDDWQVPFSNSVKGQGIIVQKVEQDDIACLIYLQW